MTVFGPNRILLLFLAAFALLPTTAQARQAVINEIMPANASVLADDRGRYSDWIELFNASDSALDLSDFALSDDADIIGKWKISNLTMEPRSHSVLFASGFDSTGFSGTWESVVAVGDQWRYIVPTSEPASSWTDPGYNDTSWSQGPTGIGYGDNDDATVVLRAAAVFARIRFDIADPASVSAAQLHMDYDDGFVAYLNGTEIGRANMGDSGNRPIYSAWADNYTEPLGTRGLPLARYPIQDPSSLLRVGENILAVQVHNANSGSSDLTMIPYLTLGVNTTGPATRPPPPELGISNEQTFHTNFRLSANGETLYLSNPAGEVVDSLQFGAIPTDVSLGRQPDGGPDWRYFDESSPGAVNSAGGYLQIAPMPVFSIPAGRYSGAITVEISPGTGVRYTINGSEPTTASTRYLNPISLTKTTVIRAQTLVSGNLPSPVVSHTYLINESTSLPIVSVSTDPSNFWDRTTGIYGFPPEDQAACSDFPHFCANFWEDLEVPVHLELFEPDGTFRLGVGAGAKIFGGWSRGHAQKSLGLFARGRYGTPEFSEALFPDRPYTSYQSFILRNSGNDWTGTMLRDGFISELVAGTEIDRMVYRPAIMYLNGAYWGIHNLREKINEHYAASLAEVRSDQIDMLGLGTSTPTTSPEVMSGSNEHFLELIATLRTTNMANTAEYEALGRMMDIENFIDYQIAQIFIDNRDWPGNNVKLWRPQTPEGRWRWVLYDTDFGFGPWGQTGNYAYNTLAFAAATNGPNWPNPPWSTEMFRRLLQNGQFRTAFINRFADFLNVHFEPSRMLAVLDSVKSLIEDEIPRHNDRWGAIGNWEGELANVAYFAERRGPAVVGHIQSYFGLTSGPRIPLTVLTTDGGRIRVNRELVDGPSWTGSYFRGISFPITAVPSPGYRFVEWSEGRDRTSRTQSLNITRATTIQALFELSTGEVPDVRINEIQYHAPADLDSEDWVELINTGTTRVELTDWQLEDENGNRFVLPVGTRIEPAGYAVLARSSAAYSAAYSSAAPAIGNWTFGLGNGGDTIRLLDESGALVDSVAYSDAPPWPIEADGFGATLERNDPMGASSDPLNWRASLQRGGTPGQANDASVDIETDPVVPVTPMLGIPYPNPFQGSVAISLGLPQASRVSIEAFDSLGRRVAVISDGILRAGYQSVRWDASSLPPGVYLIRLTAGTVVASRAVVHLSN